ncbi:ribosomal RNA small subunit methyltransferase A [Candidatus Parcubacteria bacterium]|nr:MAG: ribosomal RNA small subunit methyltransferase A [Candidatus Parcubacteria bacterium]
MALKQMDIFAATKSICRQFKVKPVRSKGQNFLISEPIYNKIITSADLSTNEIVLEVGAGLGFLTERLATRTKKVIAVELDDKLAQILAQRLKRKAVNNVEIINQDVLKIQNLPPFHKIVANLPYNITSLFLRRFLSGSSKRVPMVLLLQREVAERIVAAPPKMSLLALSVQLYAQPQIIAKISPEAFWPPPQIESVLIKIIPQPLLYGEDKIKSFFTLAKFGFSAKRKKLQNNLAAGLRINSQLAAYLLDQAGLASNCRAQELSLDDWWRLYLVCQKYLDILK